MFGNDNDGSSDQIDFSDAASDNFTSSDSQVFVNDEDSWSAATDDGAEGAEQLSFDQGGAGKTKSKSKHGVARVFGVLLVVVVVIVFAFGYIAKKNPFVALNYLAMTDKSYKDKYQHDSSNLSQLDKSVEDIQDDHVKITGTISSLTLNNHVNDGDLSKLKSIVDKTDKDNATFAALPYMAVPEAKPQLDRYAKATDAEKGVVNEYLNNAKTISSVYEACDIWDYVSDQSDIDDYNAKMKTCRSRMQPLSASTDPAMKTFVASMNTVLDTSEQAVKQIAAISGDTILDRAATKQIEKLNKDVDTSSKVMDYVDKYGDDLCKECDKPHLEWAFDRSYQTARAAKDAKDEADGIVKMFFDGYGKTLKGENRQKTGTALDNVAKAWNFMIEIASNCNHSGFGNLKSEDIDDINNAIAAADQANQRLADQLAADNDKDNKWFADYLTAYNKDKTQTQQYIKTLLAVSDADSLCVKIPMPDNSDPTYSAYTNGVAVCQAALKPLGENGDNRMQKMVTRLNDNFDGNLRVIRKMKALGSPDEASSGKHKKEYHNLNNKLVYDQEGKREGIFNDYKREFDDLREHSGVTEALWIRRQ
ncbi:hypothetical protein OZX57_03690 [Bifidobacterium sp. ESL0682]|uniref:hypothetical protein n=1 Tax=Bifidobacterium sp. ESL0682 TaxID=2983212 RepID=UPI0023F95647|nr:hypothetical protein [Bifidobacterium sp. ESL0682]WEV42538.1 hypothetical protein OZX57_03690 [Bifidobacterium sp. ESL0682]